MAGGCTLLNTEFSRIPFSLSIYCIPSIELHIRETMIHKTLCPPLRSSESSGQITSRLCDKHYKGLRPEGSGITETGSSDGTWAQRRLPRGNAG